MMNRQDITDKAPTEEMKECLNKSIDDLVHDKEQEIHDLEDSRSSNSALDEKKENEKSDDESSPDKITNNDENFRLGGRSPVSTILHLTIGPLLSQLCQSFYGLMDSFWVSRSIGQKGMTVMSIIIVVDFINIAFAQFFNVSMSAKISYLFGKNQKKECGQVVVDILRLCIIVGLIVPAILIPCIKPLMRWYGGDDEIVAMCFEYLLVTLCCSMINYTYLSLCGLLQAMGNSVIYGICNLTSSCLNMLVFDPLFLLGFKTGMWGVSFATILSNFCPMLVLYIYLFCGKFTVKPSLKSYFKKFNPHSFDALRVSISQLISNLATSIPMLLLSKLLGKSAASVGIYNEVMASWNVNDRLYTFAICVCNGLNQGFLPAASYAFGNANIKRLSKMYFITIAIGTSWTIFVCVLIEAIPQFFARIWGSDPLYIEIASKSLRIEFITCMANQVVLTTTACLQAIRMVTLSVVNSFITMLIPIPVFSVMIYFIDKHDPIKLMYSFMAHDLWALVFSIGIILWKLRFLWKPDQKEEKELSQIDDQEDPNHQNEINECYSQEKSNAGKNGLDDYLIPSAKKLTEIS